MIQNITERINAQVRDVKINNLTVEDTTTINSSFNMLRDALIVLLKKAHLNATEQYEVNTSLLIKFLMVLFFFTNFRLRR